MKQQTLTIVLCAAAQVLVTQLVSAQSTATASPSAGTSSANLPPFGKPSVSEMLSRMLSLTDAQRAQIQPYVDTVQPQLDAVRQQAHQAEDALLKQLHTQIRPFLTTEQQTRLDALETIRLAGPPSSAGGPN